MKLTSEIAHELLYYDSDNGLLFWRLRADRWFKTPGLAKLWNDKHANKEAFTTEFDKGYKRGFVLGKPYLAHRVAWLMQTGEWPEQIDHVNGNRSDNRWGNLRSVSHAENCKNMKLNKFNKSGKPGVELVGKKWMAKITANGIVKLLGYFETFEEACEMRGIAERNYGFHPNHGRIK